MKKLYFLLSLTYFFSLFALAQIPDGYYDSAEGLHGQALRAALHDIIDDHNAINYGDIYGILDQTDQKPNGKVWDMYSDVPGGTPPYEFSFGQDECGNYGGEGDCFNKEHSWPKSWFGGKVYPMYSDLFHIVPTDGYVNNRRGNYPYGEVGSITWLSQNGSKVGSNTYPGYTGTVFEPIDEYKGDFARGYFYMSTRYYGEDSGWPGSDAVDGSNLKQWTKNMLLEWSSADPVSQKEIDRCNAVYNIQGNRNPFIDHPEYIALIWDPNAAVSQLQLSDIVNIYPSSNGELLNIDALKTPFSAGYQIKLYNISGQQLSEEEMIGSHDEVNISQLKKGCYILSLQNTKNNQSYHFKFIK